MSDKTINTTSAKKAINYSNIVVDEFPVLEILSLEIDAKENEHSTMVLVQRFEETNADMLVFQTMVGTPITVSYLNSENKKVPIFCGEISKICSFYDEDGKKIEIQARSLSAAMDVMRKSISYQDPKKTYEEVMNKIAKKSDVFLFYPTTAHHFTKNMPDFLIQYKETDWDYLKRLASHKNQGLFVDMSAKKCSVFVGCQDKPLDELEALSCEYHKDLKAYNYEQANYLNDLIEEDYLIYQVKSYQFFPIGGCVQFSGKKLYIKQAHYSLKTNLLVATYQLCLQSGCKVRKLFNENLKGISINGVCQKSERDKVQIWLNIDEKNNAGYLFPYSTLSASPDGSGWYCMPVNGDLLRVYFPENDETKCFAISSESSYQPQPDLDGTGYALSSDGSGDMMSDPNTRYLRTPNNKELVLSPSGITINSDKGQALMSMDNQGNVTICSAGAVSLNASNDVSIIAGNNVTMMASQNISIKGASGSIEMTPDGKTKVTGEYILEN